MSQRLLEGNVDDRDALIEALTEEKVSLERQLREAKVELVKARREASTALVAVRHQLSPWYDAMKLLFGELDKVSVQTGDVVLDPVVASNPRQAAAWQTWRPKLNATAQKVGDALLAHGELSTQQLSMATGLHRTTVPAGIHALNKAGIIHKNDGRFSLKQL